MATVLHLLPHRGGGAETYIDALEGLEGYIQRRVALSASRRPLAAAGSIATHLRSIRTTVRETDLVHVHGDTAALLSLWVLPSARLVWTTHGLHLLRRSEGSRRRVVEHGLRSVVERSRVTLCTSKMEREELRSFLRAEAARRLRLVPNGVELPPPRGPSERIALRRELAVDDAEFVVLFVGELEERKDPLTALRAAQTLRERGVEAVLLVAGTGPLERQLAALRSPVLRLLGFRRDVPSLLDAADAFVLPSAREGLSFALLEAMSHGLVPVVADGAGNGEAVGAGGLVVPPGDAAALANALERIARDPVERAQLGMAARERVSSKYPVERLRRGVAKAYGDALAATELGRAAGAARV